MQFTYRARKDAKSEASGIIEAIDLSSAVSRLKQSGLFPLEVVPLERSADLLQEKSDRPLTRLELALWGRTLGQALHAGLSLTQALHLLAQQEKGRPVGFVAERLERQVTAGMSLADAMQSLGRRFSRITVSLARAGGAGGALEQVMLSLADQAEAEADLIGKVRGALVYPFFILLVGVGTVAVLLWVVVPKLGALFMETGQPLPILTRWMMSWGRTSVLVVVAAMAAAGAAWGILRRRGGSARLSDWMSAGLGRLPFLGRFFTQAETARLSSTLALLISQGLPLPEALRLAADTVSRSRLKEQLGRIQRDIVEGASLSAAMRKAGISEAFLLTLVAMGEAQGDLAAAFQQAADRYQSEVDRSIKVLSSLIEPVMILLVGLMVGGIVFSMLLPIFQINFAVG
ncbi:MAG: type II secretion system F family protein [Deltaproteobacteria bacterium]|nr:type II secretion system F family protein [Deltaproteobacteria bacterium]